jgi:hypothetical protein
MGASAHEDLGWVVPRGTYSLKVQISSGTTVNPVSAAHVAKSETVVH